MPTSCPEPSEAGFSLVELLAVLAIMSLMVGAVVLSLPAGPGPVERGSAQLVQGLQARLDTAARDGDMRALSLNPEGLQVWRDEGGQLVEDATLAWPDGARVSARLGDVPVELSADVPSLVWVEPFGAVPPLSVDLRGADGTVRIAFDARGRVARETVR